MKKENDDIKKNGSGVNDPTAYEAIKNLQDDEARMHKLIDAIRNICNLSGFYIEGRITLKSKKTGKIYY